MSISNTSFGIIIVLGDFDLKQVTLNVEIYASAIITYGVFMTLTFGVYP